MRYSALLSLVLGLSGCVGTPLQSTQVESSVVARVPVLELSLAQVEPSVRSVNAIRLPVNGVDRERIASILALLDRADLAVKSQRLAEPRGESAVDYYRQVLQLQPGYEEAELGLEKIANRYLQWSAAAARKGRGDAALHYLALARQADPDSIKVKQAQAQIQALNKAAPQSTRRDAQPVDPDSVKVKPSATPLPLQDIALTRYAALDAQQLKVKSSDLVALLGSLADRIRAEDTRVTIEAPTDSQGRWIYLQLNQRHEDYRVRANLRLAPQPGVRLLD